MIRILWSHSTGDSTIRDARVRCQLANHRTASVWLKCALEAAGDSAVHDNARVSIAACDSQRFQRSTTLSNWVNRRVDLRNFTDSAGSMFWLPAK